MPGSPEADKEERRQMKRKQSASVVKTSATVVCRHHHFFAADSLSADIHTCGRGNFIWQEVIEVGTKVVRSCSILLIEGESEMTTRVPKE